LFEYNFHGLVLLIADTLSFVYGSVLWWGTTRY